MMKTEHSDSRLCNGKKLNRRIHKNFRKAEEESQRETAKTYFPKSRREIRQCILQYKSVYEGMAWILRHTITRKRLARWGYYDISEAYKSVHSL